MLAPSPVGFSLPGESGEARDDDLPLTNLSRNLPTFNMSSCPLSSFMNERRLEHNVSRDDAVTDNAYGPLTSPPQPLVPRRVTKKSGGRWAAANKRTNYNSTSSCIVAAPMAPCLPQRWDEPSTCISAPKAPQRRSTAEPAGLQHALVSVLLLVDDNKTVPVLSLQSVSTPFKHYPSPLARTCRAV